MEHKYIDLPTHDQDLLNIQEGIIVSYQTILDKRIYRATTTKDPITKPNNRK